MATIQAGADYTIVMSPGNGPAPITCTLTATRASSTTLTITRGLQCDIGGSTPLTFLAGNLMLSGNGFLGEIEYSDGRNQFVQGLLATRPDGGM